MYPAPSNRHGLILVHLSTYFTVFQGTSHGGRQFLRSRWSNHHIVQMYGKSDRLFTKGIEFKTC
jgi:hypothetical protein